MNWIEIETVGAPSLTQWQRRVGVDSDGTVYVSVELSERPAEVLMSASWDGARIVANGRHAYVSADWLAKEMPKHAKGLRLIEAKALEMLKRE